MRNVKCVLNKTFNFAYMKVYRKYKGSNTKRLWAINILSPFFITRFKEEPLQTTKCPHLYLPKW